MLLENRHGPLAQTPDTLFFPLRDELLYEPVNSGDFKPGQLETKPAAILEIMSQPVLASLPATHLHFTVYPDGSCRLSSEHCQRRYTSAN